MSDREVESSKLRVEGQSEDAAASASQPSTLNHPLRLSPGRRAWSRFWRNRPARLSVWYLGFLILLIALWPLGLRVVGATGPKGADLVRLTSRTGCPTHNSARPTCDTGS